LRSRTTAAFSSLALPVLFWASGGLLTAGSAALAEPFRLPCQGVPFTEVADELGARFHHDRGASEARHLPETMGAGLAWLDFDGDGWIDLYAVQSGPFPPDGSPGSADRLLRNRPDPGSGGRAFEEVGGLPATGVRGYGQGVVAGDVNGDGAVDLYLTNFGPDRLLLNRGDGTFRDATAEAGIAVGGWSSSAALGDGDGDGDPDLYVTRYVDYDPQAPLFCGDPETGLRRYCDPSLFGGAADVYLVNQGDGTFRDATAEAGLSGARGRGLGALFTDLDGDGRPDLYVANDLTLNLFFRNRGDGRFEDLSLLAGVAANADGKPEAGMGVAAGDVDGDGAPEVGVTNFDVETNTLYRNLALGGDLPGFEDISAASGFGPPSFNLLGFGLVFADLDLDGDLDAWVANGHIFEDPARDNVAYTQPDLLLLGDGRGHFRSEACGVLATGPAVGRGLAAGDFDNDGDVDLAISNSGGPLALLRNEVRGEGQGGGAFLGVILRGGRAGGLGAKVTLETQAETTPARPTPTRLHQLRQAMAGDSYQSTSDRRLLFGLPPEPPPRTLEITWPTGQRRRLRHPPAGVYLVVSDGG